MAGITLAQLAKNTPADNALLKAVLLNLIREAPIMENFPFKTVDSLQVTAQRWSRLPTAGGWRSLNEGGSSYEDGEVEDVWESLYGFTRDITFDTVVEKIKTIVDPVQQQIEMAMKSIAISWVDTLINGDHANDPKAPEGLKKRVASISSQNIWFASNSSAGLDATASAANARKFFNTLYDGVQACNGGKASAIYANKKFISGVRRAAFLLSTGNFLSTEYDVLGRPITKFEGIPLIDVGLKKDQSTEIIPLTETGGTGSANTTSAYVVSYDTTEGIFGIQLGDPKFYDPLNGGEMSTKPSKMRRFDWWNGFASFGSYGIVRMRNLLDPASWTE